MCVISRIDLKISFQKNFLLTSVCWISKTWILPSTKTSATCPACPGSSRTYKRRLEYLSLWTSLKELFTFFFWHLTCPSSVRIGICTSPLVVAVVDTGVVALRAPSLKSTGPQEATEVYSPTWKITVGGLFKKGRASIFSPKCSHPPILPWLCRPSHLPRLSLLRRDLLRKLKA